MLKQLCGFWWLSLLCLTPDSGVYGVPLKSVSLHKGVRVAVYTGSFDPFHKAHAAIVETLLQSCDFVLVHADQEFYFGKPRRTYYTIRHEMLTNTYAKHPRVLTSIDRLIDIIRFLREKQVTIVSALGSDHLGRPESIFFIPDAWVINIRPSDEQTPHVRTLKVLEGKPITLIRVANGDISATQARSAGTEGANLVPPTVQQVIEKYHLYPKS